MKLEMKGCAWRFQRRGAELTRIYDKKRGI